MYTSYEFGIDLKKLVSQKLPTIEIGKWAYVIYADNCDGEDRNFLQMLLTLAMMELGEQFEFPHSIFDMIADDLISGKEVKYDLNKYKKLILQNRN